VDDPKGRRELYQGFTDTFIKGIEFALTLAIFAGMGYGLDRLLGMVPVLTIVFFLIGVVGLGTKTYYEYEAKMQALEAAGPWARARQRATERPSQRATQRPGQQGSGSHAAG
jgi:putative F0F1-ATPase subunit (Ca2+/Mg2+ transporter)